MSKVFAITPVHDLLLRGSIDMPVGLYHLHQATAEQLTRLHYKAGMLKTVSKRLKVLTDNGFVQADCVPTKLFKSPYYYALATKGMRYLADIGMDIDSSFRASKEVSESYLHLRHALELNDVLIAALRLKQVHPQFYLARYVHERTPGRQEPSLALILEHDRGTEQQEHFRRRIRAYKAFLQAESYKTLLSATTVTICFTTFISTRRVMQMRAWTYQELQDSPQLAQMFVFAELPRLLEPKHLLFDKRWLTLEGDQPIALLAE